MFFSIIEKIQKLGKGATNQHYTVSGFSALIRSQFKTTDFIIKTHRSDAVDHDMIVVSGYYDPEAEQDGDPHTEIILNYNTQQTNIASSKVHWDKLAFDLAECVGHEMVHRKQGIRCLSSDNEPEYYSSPAEIEAYGFSIAAESFVFKRPITECSIYQLYAQLFDKRQDIMLLLNDYISKYSIHLETNNE